MSDHPILFIPGPTEVDAELRQIMAMPLIGHRDPKFVSVVQEVSGLLRQLFASRQHAVFETCPATALMEAAIRNLVPRGGSVLHLVCGAFSERWGKISAHCGRKPEVLAVPLGQAHTEAQLRDKLLTSPPFEAIAITHNETSTGVIEPLQQFAAVVREVSPETLIMVDVVTSFAGAPIAFDAWGLDLAFAGTQKCLALPPGLTVFAVSDRALQRAAAVEERGFLFDFPRTVKAVEEGKTLATPCVPLVYALQRQLRRVLTEGLEARWARHAAMRQCTLDWAGRHGIAPFVADASARSPTVSCLQASGHDVEAMAKRAMAGGFKMDKGYGDLKGQTFRVGHMGDHPLARVEQFLQTLLG